MRAVELLASTPRSRILLCAIGSEEQPIIVKALKLTDEATAVRAAREISIAAQAMPFTVASSGWFCSGPEVYMTLEFQPGGDVDLLIDREGALSPQAARFYTGCAALALEVLHEQSIVHRDVKPDNLCIGHDGYAKVADLGYARTLAAGERAATLVGTPEYLAPEVFLGEGSDARSDMWSLGTSLYVMLLASHPYGGSSPQELYHRVLNEPLFFPSNHFTFSEPAKALLSACISRDAAIRPTAAGVWELDFFAKALPPTMTVPALDKESLLKKMVTPPFVPRLGGPFDTRYFAKVDGSDSDVDENELEEGEAGGSGCGNQKARLRYIAVEQPGGDTVGAASSTGPAIEAARLEAALRLAKGAADPSRYSQAPCNAVDLIRSPGQF